MILNQPLKPFPKILVRDGSASFLQLLVTPILVVVLILLLLVLQAALQDTTILGLHCNLVDVKLLRERLVCEACIITWLVDKLGNAGDTLVLAKLNAVRLRGELLSSPHLNFKYAARSSMR